ncbi:MAG: alpha/beta hydrolase [Sandaracinaceae bacterium]|nr:alpha/beta hydrolase [Sandaracinaceae bacterium]
MKPPHRIESALGSVTIDAVRRLQRLAQRVQIREHRDARGRRTPILEVGTPRRGTVVWLHGFGDRFDTILQAAPHLASEWRIVAPSMPAFGEGWVDPDERHTFDAYAGWIEAVLRDAGPSRFHLMGNSLGGATALAVAARMPEEVLSVVAVDAAGVRIDGVHCAHVEMSEGHNLFEVRDTEGYERLQRRIFAKPLKLPRWIEAFLYEEQRRNADWFIRLGQDLATSDIRVTGDGWQSYLDLPSIAAPTLALWGDQDSLFPVSQGERIASAVQNGRFEQLEGVGHVPHLEAPKRLAEAFSAWARRIS